MDNQEELQENRRVIYKCAQETAHHGDIIIWQVTSIMWGANILLLGFVLEAIQRRPAQPLIIAASIIGFAMTLYVSKVWTVCKIGQHIGFEICRHIEEHFPEDLRLHTQIDAKYPRGTAQRWTQIITGIFLVTWVATFVGAIIIFCKGG